MVKTVAELSGKVVLEGLPNKFIERGNKCWSGFGENRCGLLRSNDIPCFFREQCSFKNCFLQSVTAAAWWCSKVFSAFALSCPQPPLQVFCCMDLSRLIPFSSQMDVCPHQSLLFSLSPPGLVVLKDHPMVMFLFWMLSHFTPEKLFSKCPL